MTRNPDQSSILAVSVACVDDDPLIAKLMEKYLGGLGCSVEVFTEPAKCLSTLAKDGFDIVITDLRMPAMDGVRLLAEVKKISPSTEVIIITGDADKRAAIEAVKLGAFDFFEKPILKDQLIESVKRTIRYAAAVRDRDRMSEQLAVVSNREARQWGIDAFIGRSKAIQKVVSEIRLLQKNDLTNVLVTGESGTGKELVARAIHFGSTRSSKPFIPVNCSAMPRDLAESLFFGHVRGAFTGATTDKQGAFENANEGTLFLDEIGDTTLEVQAKLLRVLEDGIVVPVGKNTGRHVNVRVVAATNADLQQKIADKTFRSDLFYRLSHFSIPLPPLRSRKEDIALLVSHFADTLSGEMGLSTPTIEPEAVKSLQDYDFPGNVRELKNIIERALITSGGKPIGINHLNFLSVPSAGSRKQGNETGDMQDVSHLNLQELERLSIKKALAQTNGNVSEAARMLGISRPRLYRKLDDTQRKT